MHLIPGLSPRDWLYPALLTESPGSLERLTPTAVSSSFRQLPLNTSHQP